ncbi:hypothetical protein D3C84_1023130 [compost metagenome]
MSDMEHNKGKLIPTNIDTENFTEDDFENLEENGFVVIDGEVYSVEWEIKRGELYDFAYVDENEDGSISFNTYHYNGAAHWTEVVESALK